MTEGSSGIVRPRAAIPPGRRRSGSPPRHETVACLFELFREHRYLAPLQVEHGLIAQQAHIRGCASSSTCSSVTRNVSRAPSTWLSA